MKRKIYFSFYLFFSDAILLILLFTDRNAAMQYTLYPLSFNSWFFFMPFFSNGQFEADLRPPSSASIKSVTTHNSIFTNSKVLLLSLKWLLFEKLNHMHMNSYSSHASQVISCTLHKLGSHWNICHKSVTHSATQNFN